MELYGTLFLLTFFIVAAARLAENLLGDLFKFIAHKLSKKPDFEFDASYSPKNRLFYTKISIKKPGEYYIQANFEKETIIGGKLTPELEKVLSGNSTDEVETPVASPEVTE